ncbi:hypothetical protein RRG08_049063 [Elysia crispata]|uniref:Uncharacterized protein n=1 Tax=Elysia crispata TaxID=231223 RepID=A0AAE1DWB4_9GAST|nr:hypothetical protein RRG08_049063 [Elysia crispata]
MAQLAGHHTWLSVAENTRGLANIGAAGWTDGRVSGPVKSADEKRACAEIENVPNMNRSSTDLHTSAGVTQTATDKDISSARKRNIVELAHQAVPGLRSQNFHSKLQTNILYSRNRTARASSARASIYQARQARERESPQPGRVSNTSTPFPGPQSVLGECAQATARDGNKTTSRDRPHFLG